MKLSLVLCTSRYTLTVTAKLLFLLLPHLTGPHHTTHTTPYVTTHAHTRYLLHLSLVNGEKRVINFLRSNSPSPQVLWQEVQHNVAIARERYLNEAQDQETVKESDGEGSSDEGEEFEDDNNDEDDLMADLVNESADNDSVSSSFVDSGIENNEISSLSLENGHTSGEG